MKAHIKMLFIAVVTIIIAGIGLLYFLQESMIFPAPAFDQQATASMASEGLKPVSIATPDGETLKAFFYPSKTKQAIILVFHGNGDAAAYQQIKAKTLINAGFGVLLVEYRGYGGSTGRPTQTGLIIDAKASYDFVRKMSDLPIGLYAHSLGTGVAIKLANQRKVFSLVLESAFDSLLAVAQKSMPWVPMQLLLKHKFRSDQIIGKIKVPILFLHGSKDNIIPIKRARKLAKLAPPNSRFVEINGAGHNDLAEFGTVGKAVEFFSEILKRQTNKKANKKRP